MPHLLLINHHSSQSVASIANFITYYKHEQEFHHCNILFSLSTLLALRTVVVHLLYIHKQEYHHCNPFYFPRQICRIENLRQTEPLP